MRGHLARLKKNDVRIGIPEIISAWLSDQINHVSGFSNPYIRRILVASPGIHNRQLDHVGSFLSVGRRLGLVVGASGGDENSPLLPLANLGVNGFSIITGWLYHALLESSPWQGTIGKKVLGLRVTDLNGNRIGFGKATGRYFGMILSGMICLIGFVMVAFTEKKQGLHDMLAGTLVVRGPAPVGIYPMPPPPPDFSYRGGGTWS